MKINEFAIIEMIRGIIKYHKKLISDGFLKCILVAITSQIAKRTASNVRNMKNVSKEWKIVHTGSGGIHSRVIGRVAQK